MNGAATPPSGVGNVARVADQRAGAAQVMLALPPYSPKSPKWLKSYIWGSQNTWYEHGMCLFLYVSS